MKNLTKSISDRDSPIVNSKHNQQNIGFDKFFNSNHSSLSNDENVVIRKDDPEIFDFKTTIKADSNGSTDEY